MLTIIGAAVVLGSVVGGYLMHGGRLGVLWQPSEVIIIFGAAIGAYVISNPRHVLSGTGKSMGELLRGAKHKKEDFVELLSMQYQVYKIAKTKGLLALETHIEKPDESAIFQAFPKFANDHHAVTFFCDHLRLISLGTENPHELEALMDVEIETHHAERMQVPTAIQTMADAMPALGIVAAVLGVITTMGQITEPPEVLGSLIGAALVGTFLGVLIAYGFVAPIAAALKSIVDAEEKYYQCMKAGLLAYVTGYAPAVAVEFARKSLFPNVRPTFYEVEEATAALPPA